MDLIEIANTNKEELLDLWVEGDIQELLLVMLKNCKKEPKPLKNAPMIAFAILEVVI